MERLDKILVSQGVGSRREVAKLIRGKCVTVNGETATKPELKLDPETAQIKVNGRQINYREHLYIMMNKPAGVVSATEDRLDDTVLQLLPEELRRAGLFPAGRLDKDTEGLLIITDDGKWAHRLISPKSHVYKRYFAQLDGKLTDEGAQRLEAGIKLRDGTEFLPARVYKAADDKVFIEICEGKFHQVKRMFSALGLTVTYLRRVKIGGLELDESLALSECRELTEEEKSAVFVVK